MSGPPPESGVATPDELADLLREVLGELGNLPRPCRRRPPQATAGNAACPLAYFRRRPVDGPPCRAAGAGTDRGPAAACGVGPTR